jgi:creatinine amidohydrolase
VKSWIPDARNFAYLTWKQVDALSRDKTVLVLPTAAIEQHGQHLPLATDTLINSILLGAALTRLPQETPIYALPAICYGKSNEHIGFPGTLSVSASTFMAVVRDIGASIAASGFKKLVLYNTHGGNSSLVDVMARDLRAEFGLRVFSLFGSVNYIADIAKPELLRPENAAATFAWLTRDIAPSGVMGDPNPATAEKGRLWIEEAAEKIAAALTAMAAYENWHKP